MLAFPFFDLVGSQRWRRPELLRSVGLDLVLDPIRGAIERGILAGNAERRLSQDVLVDAGVGVRATDDDKAAICRLLSLVVEYPRAEELQRRVAQLMTEMGREHALEAWLGISLRFPASMDAFHNLIQLTRRYRGAGAVRTVLRARFPSMPTRLDQLAVYAEACDAGGDTDECQAAFALLALGFAKRKESWLLAASWLEEEVGIHRLPVTVLRRLAAGAGFGPPLLREHKHVHAVIGGMELGNPNLLDNGSIVSVRVLGALFERVLQQRRMTASVPPRTSGPLLLLTGSLGAGGAERQLVATAVGLKGMSLEERKLADGSTLDSVDVVARSLRDREDGAFYLADLQQAGVEVHSYREWPDFAGNLSISAVRPALRALAFLPWSTAEAVIKLTDRLRAMNPGVVHIWQDGLVYATGLAALLAGVPRIVLNGRSTPPPDRRERYLVEYDVIYKSLLRAPGVTLSVNSTYAAGRYAKWLDIDTRQITVIPNGVAPLPTGSDAASEALFHGFLKRTEHSTLTLGAVMRLDEVKRPVLWIDAAAAILAKVPGARFIVVGGGPYRTRVEKRAKALGIAGRCLFVGRSTCVGYWLSKMDALMLLSEHEGLPNALIEAQLAGIPVITTAAGGAPETLIPGTTGLITSLHPSPREVAGLVAGLVAQPGCLQKMGVAAEEWAKSTFPIGQMLSNTLQLYGKIGESEPYTCDASCPATTMRGGRHIAQ